MNVSGTYLFSAPLNEVWNAVLDPDVLSKSLPGMQTLETIGENKYRAVMKVRMGPVQGQFNGTVELVDLNPPTGYHILLDASGAQGFVKGEGDLTLVQQGENTELQYSGEAQVGGRIASVGQRLMESSAQALIQQGLQAFEAQIQARLKGVELGEEDLMLEAPSEMEFAAGVAQKMFDDLVPVEKRGELLKAGLAIVVVLFLLKSISDWWTNRLANKVADVIEKRS
jgi:hypothetical protein